MNRALLEEVLGTLSSAFRAKDPEVLLRLFSARATVTYAGSESGEKATGPGELRALLSDLLRRPVVYSFAFRDITFGDHDDLVWLLADGECTQTGDDGVSESFAYRITGVLAYESAQWRWLLLSGSEPTPG